MLSWFETREVALLTMRKTICVELIPVVRQYRQRRYFDAFVD